MLHKLELPAYQDQLECVLDFQQYLLAFACNPNTILPLDEGQIIATFGDDIGNWLCKRLWGPKKKEQAFYKEVAALIAYSKQCPPDKGQEIVEAFMNDRDFYHQLDNSAFEFKYKKLDDEAKTVLAPLMVSFYERLLRVGFPSCIHNGQPRLLNRATLLEEFRQANSRLQVCPGCDGPRTRSGDTDDEDEVGEYDDLIETNKNEDNEDDDEGRDLSDIDHFFPKKAYPFFAVHPVNLVPLCTDCNVKIKKQKDPIDMHGNAKDVLSRTFLPFIRPAVAAIEVGVNSKHIVSIRDKEQPNSPRVHNLDRVFKLRSYWKQRLKRMIELMQYQLSEVRVHEKLTDEKAGKEIVRQKLCEYLRDYDNNIGFIEHLLIHNSYARYALDNPKELEALVTLVLGRQ